PNAFLALSQGKVAAMSTDETILLGLVQKAPNPQDYVLLEPYISSEPYGLGIRKGEAAFRNEVNRILAEMEKSGAGAKIFDIWFGPKSEMPLQRAFRFETDKI
ncbi:MAG: amino acid ABC transporter substrate-binding protein, partial [Burkholderiales bacterium]